MQQMIEDPERKRQREAMAAQLQQMLGGQQIGQPQAMQPEMQQQLPPFDPNDPYGQNKAQRPFW